MFFIPHYKVSDIVRRRQTPYDVARLCLMAPMDIWQNSTPFLRQQPSVRQKLTILGFFDINVFDNIVGQLIEEETIEVYQLDETNNRGR